MTDETPNAVQLATEITMAWLSNGNTRANPEDVPAFLKAMHDAVTSLSAPGEATAAEEVAPAYTGAVTAKKSLASPDFIISMIDGKPYRTLTRHLKTNGLDADTYRARYGLKADYPMTAPSYSEARRAMAKKIGLGRKPGQKMSVKANAKPSAKPRGIAAAKAAPKAHLGSE